MLSKLKVIDARYDALVAQLEDGATYSDPELLRKLTREQKDLEPLVTAYRAYCKAERDHADARELLSDPEMREMAQEEMQQAKEDKERLQEELKAFSATEPAILPDRELTLYDTSVVSRGWEQKRLRQLYRLASGQCLH